MKIGNILVIFTFLLGITLMFIGFSLTASIGPTLNIEISEPKLVGAAGIWILGIIIAFITPIVYIVTRK